MTLFVDMGHIQKWSSFFKNYILHFSRFSRVVFENEEVWIDLVFFKIENISDFDGGFDMLDEIEKFFIRNGIYVANIAFYFALCNDESVGSSKTLICFYNNMLEDFISYVGKFFDKFLKMFRTMNTPHCRFFSSLNRTWFLRNRISKTCLSEKISFLESGNLVGVFFF